MCRQLVWQHVASVKALLSAACVVVVCTCITKMVNGWLAFRRGGRVEPSEDAEIQAAASSEQQKTQRSVSTCWSQLRTVFTLTYVARPTTRPIH